MLGNDDGRIEDITCTSPPLEFTILCGIPSIARWIISSLEENGLRYDPTASIVVLVDAPQGFALRQLEILDTSYFKVVVTTGNLCPEYWEDIWDLEPFVLLVSHNLNGELEDSIARAVNGERHYVTSGKRTALSPCERIILRYFARGWTIEQIANYRGVSIKTVYNTLANVCEKLQMPTRRAAMLYYWGRVDLLY